MKTFSNAYTESIVTMIAVGNNKILTGDAKGDIRLWIITSYSNSYDFHFERVFSGHLKEIRCLALMSNDRFISSSADNTLRIWNIASGNCEKILKGRCGIPPSDGESVTVLPDDLIAVAGNCSPAWGAFDIWDAKTGECFFLRKQGYIGHMECLSRLQRVILLSVLIIMMTLVSGK